MIGSQRPSAVTSLNLHGTWPGSGTMVIPENYWWLLGWGFRQFALKSACRGVGGIDLIVSLLAVVYSTMGRQNVWPDGIH